MSCWIRLLKTQHEAGTKTHHANKELQRMTKKIFFFLHLPTVNEFNSDLTVTIIYVRQLNTEIVSLKALQLLH